MNKEAKRLQEILTVLKRHHLLSDKTPQNIRETLEDLGPTFVKMGQLLSARNDLIDEALSEELKKLRCSVKPMSEEEVREILASSYQGKEKEIFKEFSFVPVGSASIAETHKAVLTTGEEVAVKIKRTGIYERMTMDANLLKKAVSILRLDHLFGNVVEISSVIDEMYKSALEEMDFQIEAKHIETFKKYNAAIQYLHPLKVYQEYSTSSILVMEYIDGVFINQTTFLEKAGYDLEEIALKLADNYMKQALDDGFFHADPHSDNIKIRDGKIVYLDFGMMGRLSNINKKLLSNCLVAILKNDTREIAHILKEMDTCKNQIDYPKLTSDIQMVLAKHGTTEIAKIDIKDFATDLFSLLRENHINLPEDISMLVRGIVVIESVLEEIAPDINLMQVIKNRMQKMPVLTKDTFEKALLKFGESSANLLDLPKEALSLCKGINQGEICIEVKNRKQKENAVLLMDLFHQLLVAVLDGAMLVGLSKMVSLDRKPFLFYLYLIFSILFTIWLLYKMILSKWNRKS